MDKLLVINYTLSQYFQKDIRTKEYNGTIEVDDILITLENPPKRFKSEFNEISCFLPHDNLEIISGNDRLVDISCWLINPNDEEIEKARSILEEEFVRRVSILKKDFLEKVNKLLPETNYDYYFTDIHRTCDTLGDILSNKMSICIDLCKIGEGDCNRISDSSCKYCILKKLQETRK